MGDAGDSFKWFGEGFDGFPKSLPEDCVEYAIYIIGTGLSKFEIREQLRKVQLASAQLSKALLKDFIWQREAFKLELVNDHGIKSLSLIAPVLRPNSQRAQLLTRTNQFW